MYTTKRRSLFFSTEPSVVYGNSYRAKRLLKLIILVDDVLKVNGVCNILDIGGRVEHWNSLRELWKNKNIKLTLVNIESPHFTDGQTTFCQGDARNLSGFQNNSFDIVFSNSVIEHVGLWKDKRNMAEEVKRLAPKYFVQTPNYWFPIEPHLRAAIIHWLPKPIQRSVVMKKALGFYRRAKDIDDAYSLLAEASLLDIVDMKSLFPDAKIVRERIGPFTKSLIAIRN